MGSFFKKLNSKPMLRLVAISHVASSFAALLSTIGVMFEPGELGRPEELAV
jgi:hypothetical protein